MHLSLRPFLPLIGLAFGFLILAEAVKALLAWRPKRKLRCESLALFTEAEEHFYRHLMQVFDSTIIVCPKVRLGDVVEPHSSLDKKEIWTARNQINRKHVDFVCLRSDDLTTVGVIELDDSSHNRPDRQERDKLVDEALRSASIPICHVKARRDYNLASLADQITTDFGWKTTETKSVTQGNA